MLSDLGNEELENELEALKAIYMVCRICCNLYSTLLHLYIAHFEKNSSFKILIGKSIWKWEVIPPM
jgi:hypothetical protein